MACKLYGARGGENVRKWVSPKIEFYSNSWLRWGKDEGADRGIYGTAAKPHHISKNSEM